jgi:hypothetical protein
MRMAGWGSGVWVGVFGSVVCVVLVVVSVVVVFVVAIQPRLRYFRSHLSITVTHTHTAPL